PANRSSVLGNDLAGQPILHIRPQRAVDRKFCTLWSTCRPLSVPVRRASPILATAASRRRVAPQFARDGRCSSTKSAGDLSHSKVLCKRERDLLPLGKCQIAPRQPLRRWRKCRRRHATSLPQPTPKSAADPHVAPSPAARATSTCPVTLDPTAVSLPSQHSSRLCCDDQLIPPWLPRSEWWISPAAGRRMVRALRRAARARSRCSRSPVAQPTTRRANRAMTKARYKQPSRGHKYGMGGT